jgi:hypothetical protein
MTASPPVPTAGRLPRRARGAPAAGIFLLVVASISVSCGVAPAPSPPSDGAPRASGSPATAVPATSARPAISPTPSASAGPSAAGLVVAAGDGSASLSIVDVAGRLVVLDRPQRPIRQLRSTPGGLIAVLDDGSVVATTIDGSQTRWKRVAAIVGVAAAAPNPAGSMLVLLDESRVGQGRPLALRLVAADGSGARTIAVSDVQANGPPTWLATDRIVLRALAAADSDVLAIVDPRHGAATSVPLHATDVIASTDGTMVGFLEPGAVRIGPAAPDLRPTMLATAVPLPGRVDEGDLDVALDASGHRLAFVRTEPDGTRAIAVIGAAGDWHTTTLVPLSARGRLLVAWAD